MVVMSDIASSLGGNFGQSFEALKLRLTESTQNNPFFIKMTPCEQYKQTPITRTLEDAIRAREWVTVCYKGGK